MASEYKKVNLSSLIGPSFYPVWADMRAFRHVYYWLKGGRGSTKSSFASVRVIRGILEDPLANAVVFMQAKADIRDAALAQIMWAIDSMGLTDWFSVYTGPMQVVYKPTGQKILFRGMDDPSKTKSIKVRKGYIKFAWFEEFDRFDGMKAITTALLSIMRGGPVFQVIMTYNPPESSANWVNTEAGRYKESRYIHTSDYRTVPRAWLGDEFFREAEEMKRTNLSMYEHVFLGKVTGTGAEVFTNLTNRPITDEEIAGFRNVRHGLDLGHTNDETALISTAYDARQKILYIFNEWSKHCAFADVIFNEGIQARGLARAPIIGDAGGLGVAIIGEINRYGACVHKAQKPKNSVDLGMLWLRRLSCIVIDSRRCPGAWQEFSTYEWRKTRDGTPLPEYVDMNNHRIDSVRYGNEDFIFAGHGSRIL